LFESTWKFKRTKSAGSRPHSVMLERLKNSEFEWDKLRQLLRENNFEINKLITVGAAPKFEYPPVLYSPHVKVNL